MGGRLAPGTELSEVALSRELSVSRGPIREAIGRLAAEGLVTVRPRRGAEVRSITPEELIESYQVREALEVLAVRLAVPRMTDADLSGLDELADRMSELARQGAVGDFFTANAAFHERLCRFQARTLALRGSLDGSVTEHRAILAAIRLRDADKAAELTAAHIRVPELRLNETSGADGQPLADLMPGTVTDTA
jgi:DNA-binding GntR family transcriptional regulator